MNTNILCPLCTLDVDTQELKCTSIQNALHTKYTPNYEDIFSHDNEILLNIARNLKVVVEVREELIQGIGEEAEQEVDPED